MRSCAGCTRCARWRRNGYRRSLCTTPRWSELRACGPRAQGRRGPRQGSPGGPGRAAARRPAPPPRPAAAAGAASPGRTHGSARPCSRPNEQPSGEGDHEGDAPGRPCPRLGQAPALARRGRQRRLRCSSRRRQRGRTRDHGSASRQLEEQSLVGVDRRRRRRARRRPRARPPPRPRSRAREERGQVQGRETLRVCRHRRRQRPTLAVVSGPATEPFHHSWSAATRPPSLACRACPAPRPGPRTCRRGEARARARSTRSS